MAIRTQTINQARPREGQSADDRLAALPNGVTVAVYDSRIDAAGAAVQLSVESPEGSVWLASGADACRAIRSARDARPLLQRIAGSLSDDDMFVESVIAASGRGLTVLVVRPCGAAETLSRLADARHVFEFGRWTTRQVR